MIVGCLHVHACRIPLGTAWSTQLASLHLVALGGMLDGVGSPCKHPCTRHGCIIATATVLFSSTIAIAPSGITTLTTTTTATTAPATSTQQLHLVELGVGLSKLGSEHGDLVLGGHQIGPGASGLLRLVDQF
jgi:hypothetical protein